MPEKDAPMHANTTPSPTTEPSGYEFNDQPEIPGDDPNPDVTITLSAASWRALLAASNIGCSMIDKTDELSIANGLAAAQTIDPHGYICNLALTELITALGECNPPLVSTRMLHNSKVTRGFILSQQDAGASLHPGADTDAPPSNGDSSEEDDIEAAADEIEAIEALLGENPVHASGPEVVEVRSVEELIALLNGHDAGDLNSSRHPRRTEAHGEPTLPRPC